MIKKELLESILEVFEEDGDLQMNEEVKNAKESKDGIFLLKRYEQLLKGANRKIIYMVGKQLLKRLKEEDEFFDCVGLSLSNMYFKIRLCKFLYKFSVLKNSALTSSHFKSNFKLIKKYAR